mgnify:CR=1 FL=1
MKGASLRFLLLLSFLILFQGCKKEENLVPADKFSDLYIELLKTQDSIGTANMLVKPALDSLLKKHGVSKKLYDLTVEHYMRNPEEFRDLMILVMEKTAALKPEKPEPPAKP